MSILLFCSSFRPHPHPCPGLEFPWGPKPFSEVVAGPLLRNNGQTLDSTALEGSHVGVYFSAHWVSSRCFAEQLEQVQEVLWGCPCSSCCRALWECKDLWLVGVEPVKMLWLFWKKLQHCSGLSSSAGPSEGEEWSDFKNERGFVGNLCAISPSHVQGCCPALQQR